MLENKMKQTKMQKAKQLSNSRYFAKKKDFDTISCRSLKKQGKATSFYDQNDFQVIKLTISY